MGIAGGAAYGLARGTGWVLENTLFRPQQGSEDAAAQDVRSANNMNDASASALHAAHRQQHVRQPRKQPRLLAVRLPRSGAVKQHAAPLLLGPEPRGPAPLGPTDVSLSNWTVRPSSGCSVVLATHTAGVSVDGYTLRGTLRAPTT